VIFDGVVGPSWEEFSDEGPLVAESEYGVALLFVSLNDDLILFLVPTLLADLRVQVVVPSFSALLPDPSG
jgi:hypothetical protein